MDEDCRGGYLGNNPRIMEDACFRIDCPEFYLYNIQEQAAQRHGRVLQLVEHSGLPVFEIRDIYHELEAFSIF